MIYTLQRQHRHLSEWKSRNWNLNLVNGDAKVSVFPDSACICYIYARKWSFISLSPFLQLQDMEKSTDRNSQIGMPIHCYTGTLRLKGMKGLAQKPGCKSQKKNPNVFESALWAAKYDSILAKRRHLTNKQLHCSHGLSGHYRLKDSPALKEFPVSGTQTSGRSVFRTQQGTKEGVATSRKVSAKGLLKEKTLELSQKAE